MKRITNLLLASTCVFLMLFLAPGSEGASTPASVTQAKNAKYVVLGWNDLGMHCISPRFSEMAILPPANTVWAVVIERAEEPRLVTRNVKVTYSFSSNTKGTGKTDFWRYASQLFGKPVPSGKGLTGNGLKGTMKRVGDHFEATAIPVLPFNDRGVWNPYQKATLNLQSKGAGGRAVVTVPVSDEMECAKCHSTGGVAAGDINTPTLEGNILTLHDRNHQTTLMDSRPVLCAKCHSDNALKAPGTPGVSSLSLAMHGKHASLANQPDCYDCHPGRKTRCNRSAIPKMGPVGADPRCSDCHGNLTAMAQGLANGRQPWLQEPKCADCHGHLHDTGTVLYRNAKGHGGIYCAACHNSPHAWYPSMRREDNAQPMALKNNNRPIGYKSCYICHTDGRTGIRPPHELEHDHHDHEH